MPIEMRTPGTADLADIVRVMGEWQVDGLPMQLHPGDIGWYGRFGAARTAAALRTWTRDGRILAVGLLDGPGLLRVAIDVDTVDDEELALAMTADITRPERGVLPAGPADVEAPASALLQETLAGEGWRSGEPWLQLHLDLPVTIDRPTLRVEVVDADRAAARSAVQRAAFRRSTFTEARWHEMAANPAYADGRCLLGHDADGRAVAAVTVWSAGPGRPGLVEPMGVHEGHRGRGHGRSITLAGARVLQDLGSSSAVVATPASLTGAVRTYLAAGFEARAQVTDRSRPAPPRERGDGADTAG